MTADVQDAVSRLIAQGQCLEDAGDISAAERLYRRAVALDPCSAPAHLNLGNALQELGFERDAIASFRRAVDCDPAYPSARLNLGSLLLAAGNPEEALREYEAALAIRPDWPEAYVGLACAFEQAGEVAASETAYRKALELAPDHVGAACNLADLLLAGARAQEAREVLTAALGRSPATVPLLQRLAELERDAGRLARALEIYKEMADVAPDFLPARSDYLLALQYATQWDEQRIREAHDAFGRELESRVVAQPPPKSSGRRRLRIGYVSPDFKRHPVANFILPVMRQRARTEVEVFCYAIGKEDPDDVTDMLRRCADHWRGGLATSTNWWNPVRGSEEALAEMIRRDGIDILVDLAGHTADNLVGLFALQPAALQIGWLGYPDFSGLSRVQYRLSDRVVDPPENVQSLKHRLLYLPDTQWCYQPFGALPAVPPSPRQANGFWTFASVNNPRKLNDDCLAAWASLLREFPDSRFRIHRMSSMASRQWTLDTLAREGIRAERIRFVDALPYDDYFRSLAEADIALDSFPYNGTTTTIETLLMGVPVVGTAGSRAAARVGQSILGCLGLGDWIAASPGEIVEVARRHLSDPEDVLELRRTLRRRLETSPLMDAARFARNLEVQFRQSWESIG